MSDSEQNAGESAPGGREAKTRGTADGFLSVRPVSRSLQQAGEETKRANSALCFSRHTCVLCARGPIVYMPAPRAQEKAALAKAQAEEEAVSLHVQ